MNNAIPIFDSLTHPTINGDWCGKNSLARLKTLLEEMSSNNILWAFAVGMKSIGDYSTEHYIKYLNNNNNTQSKLFPVAFFDPNEMEQISTLQFLKSIKSLGYVGIKLHPRLSHFSFLDDFLPVVIDTANELGLTVLLCTYSYSNTHISPINNINNLIRLLLKIDPKSRLILLHGGAVRLLEMMEVTRAFNNILLDLSFTLCKYKGSSLDLDISFLFNNFDRRICIGSDFPEFNLSYLRERFNYFSHTIEKEKAENIAYKNIFRILNNEENF